MQQIIVLLLVIGASATVLYKAYRFFFTTKTNCDACSFSPNKERTEK